jgi:hypothetical protein
LCRGGKPGADLAMVVRLTHTWLKLKVYKCVALGNPEEHHYEK